MSICTGAFVLAAAGRLDGRPAATHWALADRFRRLFPHVDLDADVLFIDDGDVLTSAGAASGVDVCLHLVRKDHGAEVANEVARLLRGAAVAGRRPGAVHRPPRPGDDRRRDRRRPGSGRWSGFNCR